MSGKEGRKVVYSGKVAQHLLYQSNLKYFAYFDQGQTQVVTITVSTMMVATVTPTKKATEQPGPHTSILVFFQFYKKIVFRLKFDHIGRGHAFYSDKGNEFRSGIKFHENQVGVHKPCGK